VGGPVEDGGGTDPGPGTAVRDQPAARERLNLIEQITADAVASDYQGLAVDPAPASRRQRVLVAALALALAGFVMAIGISARILSEPAVAEIKQALADRIVAQDARRDELLAGTEELRAEVEAARLSELERTAGGSKVAARTAELELVTGYAAVQGAGAVIELDDAPPVDGEQRDDIEQVLDGDVQRAVNGLWAAGAEAIAVNGSRLTARSAIRSAAGAILVNYRPLRPPYRVEAIGPDSLLDDFGDSQDAAYLKAVSQQFGIRFSSESADGLVLPAATTALPELSEVIDSEEAQLP
jgi:uncharacterized protein YlxW (UPF0749 family)